MLKMKKKKPPFHLHFRINPSKIHGFFKLYDFYQKRMDAPVSGLKPKFFISAQVHQPFLRYRGGPTDGESCRTTCTFHFLDLKTSNSNEMTTT